MAGKSRGRGVIDRDRDYHAARLRAEGWSYVRIAGELGYADESGAWRAVQRGLKRSVAEPTAEARHLQLNALDEMARTAWDVLRRPHVVVSQGRVVTVGGEPLVDDGPVLAAIAHPLRIHERQAKLLGLDQPAEFKVDMGRIHSAVDQIVALAEGRVEPVPLRLVTAPPAEQA